MSLLAARDNILDVLPELMNRLLRLMVCTALHAVIQTWNTVRVAIHQMRKYAKCPNSEVVLQMRLYSVASIQVNMLKRYDIRE